MPGAAHILTFAQTLRGGGVERAQLRLARGWIAAGRRVTLMLGDRAGPLAAELPDGLEIAELGSRRYRDLLLAVPGAVRRAAPDILFCPGNHYTSVAGWARLWLGRACPPIVGKVSNALARTDQSAGMAAANRFWLRRQPGFLDHVVAMTPAMAAEAEAVMRIASARVSVIANPPALPLAGAGLPPLPAGRFIVGVGRLVPQKRWERLIAALGRIADRDVALVILGEGPQRPVLEAQAGNAGLAHRVFLPGHVADPLPVIGRAAALALVSDFEGVPGALREALEQGTPVVTTDSSVAVREIVASDALGSIVARDDSAALVAALDHWLSPTTRRPDPVSPPGRDSAARYLALFDRIVSAAA